MREENVWGGGGVAQEDTEGGKCVGVVVVGGALREGGKCVWEMLRTEKCMGGGGGGEGGNDEGGKSD